MKTSLCQMLGIEYPIISAPMGPDLTGPELVAAVSNAGGLGILQAQFRPPPAFREEIRRVRALTARPFGVNLLLHFPVDDREIQICMKCLTRTNSSDPFVPLDPFVPPAS